MMYLWLIPLALIVVILLMAVYRRTAQDDAPGQSRLDQARSQDSPRDLRS